jgi:hypothetical protein
MLAYRGMGMEISDYVDHGQIIQPVVIYLQEKLKIFLIF